MRGVARMAGERFGFLSRMDWIFCRSFDDPGVETKFPGHARFAVLLAFPMAWITVFGPIFFEFSRFATGQALWALPLFLAMVGALAVGMRRPSLHTHEAYYLALILLAFCGIVFLWGSERITQALVYRHIMLPMLVILGVFTVLADVLAWGVVRAYRRTLLRNRRTHRAIGRKRNQENFADLLVRVELFREHPPVRHGRLEIVLSMVTALIGRPLIVFFFASVVGLMVPRVHLEAAILVTVGSLLVVAYAARFNLRLQAILEGVERALFGGIKMVVALLLMVFAIARWLDVSYVTTVVESSSLNTLLGYLFTLYFMLWYFGYWAQRALTTRLLALFKRGCERTADHVDIELTLPKERVVYPRKRRLQLHGGARLALQASFSEKQKGEEPDATEVYSTLNLFRTVVRRAFPEEPGAAASRYGIGSLQNLVAAYAALLSIGPLVLAGGLASWSILRSEPKAELLVKAPLTLGVETENAGDRRKKDQAFPFDLRSAIFSDPPRKQVILVACSGGGTRAALYAASVLRGLKEEGVLKDVVLLSGVSGGSAALAYYAQHHKELESKPKLWHQTKLLNANTPWGRYFEVMAMPFFDDVLRATTELRMLGGTRNGILLAESFERRFGDSQDLSFTLRGQPCGLIFGTALAGREYFDPQRAVFLQTSAGSGGNLQLTNLFPGLLQLNGPRGAARSKLDYFPLSSGGISLTRAAALSANFPPVFSNALIAVEHPNDKRRYWVTDGGAAENRGIVALLVALRSAIQAEWEANPGSKKAWPHIKVICADASALSESFTQDRGVSAVVSAKDQYANQLVAELIAQINRDLSHLGQGDETDRPPGARSISYYNLRMPSALYAKGGIGTHWMLPHGFTLRSSNPSSLKPTARLNREQMIRLLVLLHARRDHGKSHDGAEGMWPEDQGALKDAWEILNDRKQKTTGGENSLGQDLQGGTHRQVWESIFD